MAIPMQKDRAASANRDHIEDVRWNEIFKDVIIVATLVDFLKSIRKRLAQNQEILANTLLSNIHKKLKILCFIYSFM